MKTTPLGLAPKLRHALIALIAWAGLPAAHAEQLPLWELGAGVAGLQLPHYRGSDQSHGWLLPVPYVVYRGEIFKADRNGARAVLFETERVHFDLSLAASAPTRSDDNRARQGMADLRPTIELGPNLNLTMAEGAAWKLDLRAPLRAAMTIESKPQVIGWIATPNLNLDLKRAAGWDIGVQAGLQFANRRFNGHFYDVAPSEATASRSAYRSPGGYGGAQFTLAASRRDGGRFIGAFARFDNLSGARFEDSPLVRRSNHLSIGIAVSWVLARSSTMVNIDD